MWWILVLSVLVLVLIVIVFVRAWNDRKKPSPKEEEAKAHAHQRDMAEDKVDSLLRQLAAEYGGYVYHDVFLQGQDGDSSELDHVYLSKAGIFLLETKGEAAVIKVEEDDAWKGRTKDKQKGIVNPIAQNQAHEERLRSLWGEGIPPIISMAVFPYGNVSLVSELAFDYPSTEEYIRERLTKPLYKEEDVEMFRRHFEELIQRYGIAREEHYQNVKKRNEAKNDPSL